MARKILLADDSVTAQNMGRKILTDAGYEVVTVNNGSAALKKIAEGKPDLIVLDVYMPGYSGLEVCQRIKENRETARIPILLTVGKLEPFKPEEARRAKADAFVVKPFEASELLAALTKLEDKIIPQPEPYKQGRFAKAMASVEQDTDEKFGDTDEGWKARLRIPTGKRKEPEPEPPVDYAATQGKGFRDLVDAPERKSAAKPAAEFERPMPAGVPHDITPEEIAAITAAAAQLSGAAAAVAPASEEPVKQAPEAPAEAAAPETPEPEAAPVTFASAPEVTAEVEEVKAVPTEVAAEVAASVEVEKPDSASDVIVAPEAVPANPEAPAAVEAAQPEMAVEQTEPVKTESTPAVEEARAETQTDAVTAEPIEGSPAVDTAEPIGGSESTFEVVVAPVEALPVEPAVIAEDTAAPVAAQVAAPADDEVMAALHALIPNTPATESAEPTITLAKEEPAAAVVPRAHSAGPRWIAEEVALAEDETGVSLEKEMEKAYAAVAAQAEPVVAAQASSIVTTIPEPAVTAPVVAAEPEPPAVYAMASAAAAGDAAPRAATIVVPAQAESVVTELPVEPPREEIPEPVAASAPQAVPEQPETGTETVEGAETMAANWKNIRDSIAGAAAKPAPAKEEFREPVKDDAAKAESEAPVSAAEKAPALAATDPKAIASIVDSVLAELRPRIVEEIARKLGDPKKD